MVFATDEEAMDIFNEELALQPIIKESHGPEPLEPVSINGKIRNRSFSIKIDREAIFLAAFCLTGTLIATILI